MSAFEYFKTYKAEEFTKIIKNTSRFGCSGYLTDLAKYAT